MAGQNHKSQPTGAGQTSDLRVNHLELISKFDPMILSRHDSVSGFFPSVVQLLSLGSSVQ